MTDLFFVAVRNVGRNKRRSLITALTVFIGVVVVSSTRGLLNGLQNEIRSGLTRKVHGDLQVHRAGYQDSIDTSPYNVMFSYSENLKQSINGIKGITSISPRLKVMALFNHQKSQTTFPVFVQGIDSKVELAVCPRLQTSITKGAMLDSTKEIKAASVQDDNLEDAIPLGSPTAQSGRAKNLPKAIGTHQIMVTPGLLRGLKAEIGDEVVLVFQDKNNMQQAVVANISGEVEFGLPGGQNKMVWMDFKTLQETLNLTEEVSELAIRTDSNYQPESLKSSLQQVIGPQLVSETYLDVAGLLRDAMSLQNGVFTAVLVVIFTIVISAIINTSLMTVLERTREIGTLMALGYKRKHILVSFLIESATIGTAGGASGLIFSLGLMKLLSTSGIHFSLPGQTAQITLFPEVTGPFLVLALGLSLLSALIAGFLPAYRASHLKPVDALSGH